MSHASKLRDELAIRFKARQPVVWVETDEPSRAAELLRGWCIDLCNERLEESKKAAKNEDDVPTHTLYEYDLVSGLNLIWTSERGIVKKNLKEAGVSEVTVFGEPVDFCNRDVPQAPAAATRKGPPQNNYRLDEPQLFITDMLRNLPPYAVVLCHNFAEYTDIAVRLGIPDSRAKMRQALLNLTGNLGSANFQPIPTLAFSGRTLIATGRLPDPDLARVEIADTFDILKLERPSEEEMVSLLNTCSMNMSPAKQKELASANMKSYGVDKPDKAIARAAKQILGLTQFSAETAAYRTIVKSRSLSQRELSLNRRHLIERSRALKLIEPSAEFEWNRVHGLENVEELAKASLDPSLGSNLRLNSMTIVGPPGTGKSMLAKAMAQHLGWAMITLDLGAVMNSLVGSSEAGMREALSIIDGLGDCVVLMDEADKQMSGMISNGGDRGDSGVSSRVMGTLLSWEQERTRSNSRALVIRTANRIKNLKTESLRAGRNDMTFFVDFPHRVHRIPIIKQYLADYGIEVTDAEMNEVLIPRTRYWSGAEIKELAKNVARFKKDFDRAFTFVRPVWMIDQEDIKVLRDEGIKAGTRASNLNVDDEDKDVAKNAASRALSGIAAAPVTRL